MRMRLKKHLDERLDDCAEFLLAREGDDFFTLTDEQKRGLSVDLATAFGNDNPIVLELGCGKGGWAIQTAQLHPEWNVVAVEKLSNVIVVACERAKAAGVQNVRFLNVRAENLAWWLPHGTAHLIALNFSCPFPKKTYANRRLTSKRFLQIYRLLLSEDGFISQKTDNKDFFEWSLQSYAENGYQTYDVCYDLPLSDSVVTEYEAKFRAQGLPIYATRAKAIW